MINPKVDEFLSEMRRLSMPERINAWRGVTGPDIEATKRQIEAITAIATAAVNDALTAHRNGLERMVARINANVPPDRTINFADFDFDFVLQEVESKVRFKVSKVIEQLDNITEEKAK